VSAAIDKAECLRQQAFAKIEIAACQNRCRENFDVSEWHPGAIIYGCYNFHHHAENLRHARERLAYLERLEAEPPPRAA